METPMSERTGAEAPDGYIIPSGLRALRDSLSGKTGLEEFMKWRSSPVTRRMVRAVHDLMMHAPVCHDSQSVEAQYGVTQCAAYILQLMTDPSVVWPGVFGAVPASSPSPEAPAMDFSTSIDDMLYNGARK